MNKKYQNIFFIFGLAVFIVMLTQLDFAQVWTGLKRAGYWFFVVIAIWLVLYMFNAGAWYTIIKSTAKHDALAADSDEAGLEGERHVMPSFWHVYKLTVSGFALNYVTPGGMAGGEPYRIMALAPFVGTERATSSVILYAMTHVFSHLWFWLLSVVVFVVMCFMHLHAFTFSIAVAIACTVFVALLGIWFFGTGYQKGFAVRAMNLFSHFPGLKKRVGHFIEKHKAQLDRIDEQTAALHRQDKRSFYTALLLELGCRVASAAEQFCILLVLYHSVNFIDCVLVLAFTSFFANMLFFIPLQLGGREGGFAMSCSALGFGTSRGIFVALIVRLRELFWVAVGLLLIKIGKKN